MAKTSIEPAQLVTTSPNAIDIRQLPKILFRRRFLIFGVSCLVVSVAGTLALIVKPNYQSSMQILVSSNLYASRTSNNRAVSESKFTDTNLEADYKAQSKLMLSNQLIDKAVVLLRPNYPDMKVEDIKGKRGKKAPLGLARIDLENGLNQTYQVFEITYKNDNPTKTKQVLEALRTVYQTYNIEQQKQRLAKGLAFVNERLPKVRNDLAQAERNLKLFRQKNNLLDPEAQVKILLEAQAQTQKQLQTTRAQLQDVQARYSSLQQKIATSVRNALVTSRLSQSTRYQSLLKEIQKTELALAQERIRYTDISPAVQKLLKQRQSQLSLLQQEVGLKLGNQNPIQPSVWESLSPQSQASVDRTFVEEMIELQTTILGLRANEQRLAESSALERAELSRYPNLIAESNRLLREVQTNRKTLEQLMQTQQSLGLKIAQSGFDWQILEAPQKGVYIGSGRILLLTTGIILGPFLGIVVALILEMLNDSIYLPYELQRLTNLRLLGTLPKLSPTEAKRKRLPLPAFRGTKTLMVSHSAIANAPSHESLDMAYQNIQIKSPIHYKSLMVTSALNGEGKSTLTLGLAVSAARMHQRILIIDANLREPSLHKYLDLPNDWGLSLLMLDEITTSFKDYIQPIHPAIDVLTAGPLPEDSVQLLSMHRIKELLEVFESSYDLILIDAPALLNSVDARILAKLCNAIVLVARMGKVTHAEVIQATEILEKLNLVGIIANQPKN